jgi:phosphinothricin acetyltransferase
MSVSVRAAAAPDCAGIAELWSRAIRETDITFNSVEKTAADIEALLAGKAAAGHGFFVAEQDGCILGFAGYGQFRGGVGYARTMEHTIYLQDGLHGRGIGRDLMTALETHARAGGAHSMWGAITDTNTGSITFHERMGYAHVCVLPEVGFKFGRLMDLVLMRKVL